MYLVGTFCMAITFYVSTGAQFWLTKYLIDVLGVQEKIVLLVFAVVSVTGPTLGVIFGILVSIQEAMLLVKAEGTILMQYTMCSSFR